MRRWHVAPGTAKGGPTLRISLLGAGSIGALHASLLAETPGVDEVLVADLDLARAQRVAAKVGATAVATVQDAIERADALVIAASTNAHPELIRSGLARRLPTFCEKPLASTLEETVALVDEAERAGSPVQVGFQRRFDPAYREARRLVASGELGTVYLVRLIAHDHEPPPESYIPVSGGLFLDSSIHDFDALRWVTGLEVEEVYAVGSVRGLPVFGKYGDVATGAAILSLSDGTLGILSQTRHDPRGYDIRMELVGSRDSVAVGLTSRTPLRSLEADTVAMPGPAWTSFLTRFLEAYQAELNAFVEMAIGQRPSLCTPRDALEAMRISVAATRSRLEGRSIRVADIGIAGSPASQSH